MSKSLSLLSWEETVRQVRQERQGVTTFNGDMSYERTRKHGLYKKEKK